MMFDAFFDDAALFPPGDAPMEVAVPAHRALVARFGSLVGPFVVPGARIEQLCLAVHGDPPFEIAVIAAPLDLPDALARVRAHPVLALAGVEVPPLADDVQRAFSALGEIVPAEVPVAVELPRSAARDAVLDALAASGYRAKVRTGGLVAEAFPSCAELAGTLAACVRRGVPFKCTAGLHRAVRHTDPASGFVHHGFLNILVAVDVLVGSWSSVDATEGDAGAAEGWLRETEGKRLVDAVREGDPARARRAFLSYGTCSLREPIEDLVGLGLLEGIRL